MLSIGNMVLPMKSQSLLEDFKKSLILKNRSKSTLRIIEWSLESAQKKFSKPLESLTIEELKKHFEFLRESEIGTNGINLVQSRFIQFFQYCLDETDNEKYSIILRKLKRNKMPKESKSINPASLLLPEDVKKLINVATLERDRCIVAVLYESGMRRGELLALTVDMVQMNEKDQEVTFHIPNIEGCKTGARSVVCLEIYGYVEDWLKCRYTSTNKFMDMSETGIRHIMDKLFKRANINKPHNIHHFRHSAITHAAGLNMNETQLSYRFWGIPHSAMLSTYIHLNEQLKSSGYRDAKGMGEGNGKTVINPLASRCVECGRLIQAGSLCKTCTESKKLSSENSELKAQMETTQKGYEELKKQMAFIQAALQAKGAQL